MVPKNKRLVIGIAGFGTVGRGVCELLKTNHDWVRRRTGCDVVVKRVVARSPEHAGAVLKMGAAYSNRLDDLVEDKSLDVVLELIGGEDDARDWITKALKAGKHVVTANKALLAKHGKELFSLASEKNLHLGFEASVAGGIPILQSVKETLAANRVDKFMGILNGTANFILTEMTSTGMAFEQALKLAQDAGYAEADPTLDVEGWDAAHKLVLLIQLAFGQYYPLDKLSVWGVSIVEPEDIEHAREFGHTIKLIAQASMVGDKIEAGVFPALIPDHYLLASVDGSFNAIRLEGNAGPVLLYGKGAGDLPTASAVLADVIAVASQRNVNNTGFVDDLPDAAILDLDEAKSRHYLRFSVADQPGVLHKVSGVLAEHEISLAQVIQKGASTPGENGEMVAPLVFLTHLCTARQIHAAMRELEAMGLPRGRIMHLRIL